MFADPKKVDGRRLRRRLKAGASIALALVAGAFLACKGGQDEPPSPIGPDARNGPKTGPTAGDGGAVDSGSVADSGVVGDGGAVADGSALVEVDAGADGGGALVVRDGGAGAAKMPKVDKREHRKGMPVRDNLLE